jgi:23S rRNA (adenine2503-C2)-methyltransferase
MTGVRGKGYGVPEGEERAKHDNPRILGITPYDARVKLGEWLRTEGQPSYRLNQIHPRLWQRPVASWAEAQELPAALRARLQEDWPLDRLTLGIRQQSTDGTVKYLWRLADGEAIESVMIPERERRTLCISSQCGCPLRCAFCATGTMGLHRNLEAWEIVAQVREMLLGPTPDPKPTNIVFMGMGEPLLNWPAVSTALTILNDPEGLGIGARHITVSTVGILPGMAELAKRPEQFRLAISLHAPGSETRLSIMPIEKRYKLADVLQAAKQFKRRITFEYVLIDGVNDREEDAAALAALAEESGALVNLLPLHPGGAGDLRASPKRRIHGFLASLKRRGVEAVLRRSRGLDIDAACGQLRLADERGEVGAEADRDVDEAGGVRGRGDGAGA